MPFPIFEPGTPGWVRGFASQGAAGMPARQQLAGAAAVTAAAVAGIALLLAPLPASILGAALLAGTGVTLVEGFRRAVRSSVGLQSWRVDGVEVVGSARALLEDIVARFDYARRMIDEVPTGLDWEELVPDVEVLQWEAARHAAQASTLHREAADLRYAEPGTPQAVLRQGVEARRDDHLAGMRVAQWEAEQLARVAGNAAAAAKVALARTGSVHDLEVVVPSARELLARGGLAEVRARLALLADVWAGLDESAALLDARMEAERRRPEPPG